MPEKSLDEREANEKAEHVQEQVEEGITSPTIDLSKMEQGEEFSHPKPSNHSNPNEENYSFTGMDVGHEGIPLTMVIFVFNCISSF